MEELIKAKRLFDDFAKDCDKILKTLKKGNNMGKMKQKAIEARSDPRVFDALVEALEKLTERLENQQVIEEGEFKDWRQYQEAVQALKLAKGKR